MQWTRSSLPALATSAALALSLLTVSCGQPEAPQRNRAPVIDALSADAEVLSPGSETTLRLQASDLDLSAAEDVPVPDGLEVTWSVDNEDWTIAGEGATATLVAADTYESQVEVTVEISDADGARDSRSIELTTGQNALPRIASVTASPNPVSPKDKITLEATATDQNEDDLSYSWKASENWSLAAETGKVVELTAPDEDGATAQIELEVSDGYGGTATRSVRVETADNAPPSISSMTASPPQVAPGGTSTVKVDATDPDEDTLTYTWSAPMGWTVEGEGNEIDVTAPDTYDASAEISVEITDERGHTATGRVLVSTRSNNGPIINALNATPQQVQRGKTVDLNVQASDPDGDQLSYVWSISSPKWTIAPSGATAKLTAPDQPGQSATVEVKVRDPDGKTATASLVVSTAPNQQPSLGSVTASPSQVAPGGTIQLAASASDPDGEALTYTWQAPSQWKLQANGDKATVTAPSSYGQTATVTVTVADSFGGSSVGSVTVSTDRNQAPTVSGVLANPPVVDKKGTSTLTVTASDANGDSLSYKWSAPKNWSTSGTGSQITVTAPDKYGAKGLFTVTVDDGQATTQASVLVQTKENQPPVIFSLTADKTSLNPKAKATLTVRAGDLENDPLSYTWKLPKGWSGSSTSDTITVTAPDKYGESVDVEVLVGDGTSQTSKKLTLTTVKNQAPTIKSLTLNPTATGPGGSSTATVTASDPLGDTLGYTWSVSGGGSIQGSGSTVTVKAPNKPSTVDVTVTVDDNHGLTVKKSAQLKVVNPSGSKTFNHTGSAQTFTVPKYVTNVTIETWGAEGGGAKCSSGAVQDDGGKGGYAKGSLSVSPGETLRVYVGGKGVTEGRGGFNGGGPGARYGAGGGGASDVRKGGNALADRVIVAGGGGGGNCGSPDHGAGGAGGGLKGQDGRAFRNWTPGGGGTQNGGGSAGSRSVPGKLGQGGGKSQYHHAGGGGGYYGGGGAYAAGGGGGSSYLSNQLANTSTKTGQRDGNGRIVISW